MTSAEFRLKIQDLIGTRCIFPSQVAFLPGEDFVARCMLESTAVGRSMPYKDSMEDIIVRLKDFSERIDDGDKVQRIRVRTPGRITYCVLAWIDLTLCCYLGNQASSIQAFHVCSRSNIFWINPSHSDGSGKERDLQFTSPWNRSHLEICGRSHKVCSHTKLCEALPAVNLALSCYYDAVFRNAGQSIWTGLT